MVFSVEPRPKVGLGGVGTSMEEELDQVMGVVIFVFLASTYSLERCDYKHIVALVNSSSDTRFLQQACNGFQSSNGHVQ